MPLNNVISFLWIIDEILFISLKDYIWLSISKVNWAKNIKISTFLRLTTHLVPLNGYKTLNEHTTTPFSLFQLLAIKPKTFIIYSLQVVIFDLSSIILHSVWIHRGATKNTHKVRHRQVHTYAMLCYT